MNPHDAHAAVLIDSNQRRTALSLQSGNDVLNYLSVFDDIHDSVRFNKSVLWYCSDDLPLFLNIIVVFFRVTINRKNVSF